MAGRAIATPRAGARRADASAPTRSSSSRSSETRGPRAWSIRAFARVRRDAYLDLLRHEFDLVLGVRDAYEVAVRHEVERVARRAHLLVHLVPAADAAWSYESNMPSCGHGYCALCRPCSASSASATPATPSSAKLRTPSRRTPCWAPSARRSARRRRPRARRGRGGGARRARQLVSEAEHRPCAAHFDNAAAGRGDRDGVSQSSSPSHEAMPSSSRERFRSGEKRPVCEERLFFRQTGRDGFSRRSRPMRRVELRISKRTRERVRAKT